MDPYKILGVERDATPEDIKASYRKMLLTYHPDKSKASNAREMTESISRAFETLSDPKRREVCDRQLHMMTVTNASLECLENFTRSEDEGCHVLACRCGGEYVVYDDDLAEDDVVLLPCTGCSIHVKVQVDS